MNKSSPWGHEFKSHRIFFLIKRIETTDNNDKTLILN